MRLSNQPESGAPASDFAARVSWVADSNRAGRVLSLKTGTRSTSRAHAPRDRALHQRPRDHPRRHGASRPRSGGSTRSTCPSTPTSRSAATPPTPAPATSRCPTTATCAPSTRGSRWRRPRRSPRGSGCRRRWRCRSSPTRSRWPRRSPPSTTSPAAGSRSAPASAGTPTSSPTTTCRPGKRRTVLREYVEAMRALWTQDEASYDGEFVSFGPSWAWPKPVQAHIPLVIGAGGGPKTFRWIAETRRRLDDHARSSRTSPTRRSPCARPGPRPAATGEPAIHVLIAVQALPRRPRLLGRGRRHRADLGRARQAPRTRCWPTSTASRPRHPLTRRSSAAGQRLRVTPTVACSPSPTVTSAVRHTIRSL